MKLDSNSISDHQPTGAEEGGAGCGALPGGGAGVPHGDTVDVQVGGDSTGLNSHQVASNTWKTQTVIVRRMQNGGDRPEQLGEYLGQIEHVITLDLDLLLQKKGARKYHQLSF